VLVGLKDFGNLLILGILYDLKNIQFKLPILNPTVVCASMQGDEFALDKVFRVFKWFGGGIPEQPSLHFVADPGFCVHGLQFGELIFLCGFDFRESVTWCLGSPCGEHFFAPFAFR